MWAALAPIGRHDETGGYRRFAWTAPDERLRSWFAGECAARQLTVTTDRMGNQWGWWGDPDAAVAAGTAGVVVGSHLDSVPDGGGFDGPLGVVSALAAVDELRQRGFVPTRPIGVVNFVDEEGARFGVACAGSRVITGALAAQRARELTDADGVSMAQAMRAAGIDPEEIGPDPQTLRRIGRYVELHIEQGRALGDLPQDHPVAVGSDIWPHGRYRVDVPGQANHAGTTRLADRRDAMVGAAAIVLAARQSALAHGCLATVGKLVVTPGGINAVPSSVVLWLDARGPQEDAVRTVVADVERVAGEFGATLAPESWTPRTSFDAELVARLAARLGDVPVLGTGAGHDAGILANAGVSVAMLFVRNRTGVSHSPAEYADEADCLAGVTALATVLTELAG